MDELEYEENNSFFDAPIIHIDHSLSSKEIEVYKNLIFSENNLEQIYFIDKCDLKTIILFKNLLNISDYIDNLQVEKFILLDLNKEDYDSLLNMTYEFPENWKLPYRIENEKMVLADIPKLRIIDSFIKEFKDNDFSNLEIVAKVYDRVKLLNYDNECSFKIPDIIKNKTASTSGMTHLFSYTLKSLGFNIYLGKIKTDEEESLITLVYINDKKYGIDGIYLFDPSSDNLPKEKYNKDIRRINYNFFMLNLEEINLLNYNVKCEGVLNILSNDNYFYAKEKEEICKDKETLKEIDKITGIFKLSFDDLYKKIKNSKKIDINTLIKINDVLYPLKEEKYNEYLKYNYETRKDELFKKNTEEELEELIKKYEN